MERGVTRQQHWGSSFAVITVTVAVLQGGSAQCSLTTSVIKVWWVVLPAVRGVSFMYMLLIVLLVLAAAFTTSLV